MRPLPRALFASHSLWFITAASLCFIATTTACNDDKKPIAIGVLHSLTGTMALSESTLVDAVKLAVDEVNATGGVNGSPLTLVIEDGQSNPATYVTAAQKLILKDRVPVVFGCWTSECRKTVKPIFEDNKSLLFYPVQYEGMEASPNIVYTGAAPNQQIIPAVRWCFRNLGRRFFLIGSDYVFPRTANEVIKEQVKALRGEIVGEAYLPLGTTDVAAVIKAIAEARPDVVLNTINGDTNVAFFREFRAAGLTAESSPVMSFSLAEEELRSMGTRDVVGHYATWNYFQSVDTPENRTFVEAFKKKFGNDRVTDDPMEAAYFGVKLWARAANAAKSTAVNDVLAHLSNDSLAAPGGSVFVDPDNRHTWRYVRVGRIRNDGQFLLVWSSERAVRPVPYPVYRAPEEWDAFLLSLNREWGGWSAPVKAPSQKGAAP